MTAPAVPRETKAPAPRPVATLDDILLELVDVDDNVRDDVGELAELQASIAELGVLSPVKVTAQPDGRYRLVYGQRRVLASRALGRLRIAAIVEPASDVDATGARRSIEQLAENLQRKDLNPIEEAVALREVLDADPTLTQEALADKLAMSRPWVSNTLGLLEAAPAVQAYVRDGELTASHAKALRGLAPKTQAELAKDAVQYSRSAHALEDEVQRHKRSEEYRRQREVEERESAKAREAAWSNAIEKKLGKQPRDIKIVVSSYYGNGGSQVGHVADRLKAMGFTDVSTGSNIASRSAALGCDCSVWKVEVQYGNLSIVPACVKNAHLQAKTKADEDKRRAKYDVETRVQARLKTMAPAACAPGLSGSRTIVTDELVARMALWHALGYRIADWAEKRGGKRGNPWPTIAALTPEDLARELGAAVADSFRDNYGYHIPWAVLAVEIGVTVEAPTPPAKKSRKAAAG